MYICAYVSHLHITSLPSYFLDITFVPSSLADAPWSMRTVVIVRTERKRTEQLKTEPQQVKCPALDQLQEERTSGFLGLGPVFAPKGLATCHSGTNSTPGQVLGNRNK